MKRMIAGYMMLTLLMLALTGCKSQDYKKAVALFESGQYSQAGTIFADLADYEESAVMVNECSYRIAREAMEVGDYETACSLLAELADYSDSAERMKECCYHLALEALEKKAYPQAKDYLKQAGDYQDAGQRLEDFPRTVVMSLLQERGELIYESDDPSYSVTLYPESDQQIGIRYSFSTMIEEIEQKQELTMVITWGETEAQLKGSSTGNVLIDIDKEKTYNILESVKGVLMLDTYRLGEKIIWSEHISRCEGGSYPNTVPIFLIGAFGGRGETIVERMVTGLQQILQTENMGITLADLGFASVANA